MWELRWGRRWSGEANCGKNSLALDRVEKLDLLGVVFTRVSGRSKLLRRDLFTFFFSSISISSFFFTFIIYKFLFFFSQVFAITIGDSFALITHIFHRVVAFNDLHIKRIRIKKEKDAHQTNKKRKRKNEKKKKT